MHQARSSDPFSILRRLAAGRLFAIGLFSLGCAAMGNQLLAFSAFLGGMAVVLPEFFQYLAARAMLRGGLDPDGGAGLARGIHLLKLLLTVALALGLVLALSSFEGAGVGVLIGMAIAGAGYLALVRR